MSICRCKRFSKTKRTSLASSRTFFRRSLARPPSKATSSVSAPVHQTVRADLGQCGPMKARRRPPARQKGLSPLRADGNESSRKTRRFPRQNRLSPHEILVSAHASRGRPRRATCSPRRLPVTKLPHRHSLAHLTIRSRPYPNLGITSRATTWHRPDHPRCNRLGRPHNRKS